MPEPLEPSPPSPGQTVGPFFHDALPYPGDRELVPPGRIVQVAAVAARELQAGR